MNDGEFMSAVRESLAGVHTKTPVEQTIGRGRTMRARRQVSGLAGALAVAAVAALALALAPASHQPHAQLAARMVTKRASGISVTISQLTDAALLNVRLFAVGGQVTGQSAEAAHHGGQGLHAYPVMVDICFQIDRIS